MPMRGILVAVACAVVMGGCKQECQLGQVISCNNSGVPCDFPFQVCDENGYWSPCSCGGDTSPECTPGKTILYTSDEWLFSLPERCCGGRLVCGPSGHWLPFDCYDYCDADTDPDAPDDPAPDLDDAVDVPSDPDDPDSEDVVDEG